MSTALPLFAYAIANDVDTDHARDAYDAIVRGLPGGPAGILDALAEIGMVPGTFRDDLRETEREAEQVIEELNEEIVRVREELGEAEDKVAEHEDTISDLKDEIADLREEIAQLSA